MALRDERIGSALGWTGPALVGLVLLAGGCAARSQSPTPQVPQPPTPPSVPTAGPPSTPTTPTTPTTASPSPAKPASQGGEAGAEAGREASKAEASGKEQQESGAPTAGGTPREGSEKTAAEGGGRDPSSRDEGEQTASGGGATEGGSAPGSASAAGGGGLPPGSAMTSDEHRQVLDGELQTALSEFDAMLLEKQKALEEQRSEDPLPARSEGGGAGGAGSAGPAMVDEMGQGTASGPRTADTATGGSPDAGGLEGGEHVSGKVEGEASTDDPEIPPDVGDGHDDDVVARQLREAAMAEKDPALREKLWDEYREYKKSAGKGGS